MVAKGVNWLTALDKSVGHSFTGSVGAGLPALPGLGGVSMSHLHDPLQSEAYYLVLLLVFIKAFGGHSSDKIMNVHMLGASLNMKSCSEKLHNQEVVGLFTIQSIYR